MGANGATAPIRAKGINAMSKPSPIAVTVTKVISASPETVYDLVSDITRIPEFSPENVKGQWIDNVTAAAVGARFKGTNRIGKTSWSTKPTVTVADRGRHFAFKVPGKSGAFWSYEFNPVAEGTLVTESMRQEVASPLPIRIIQRHAGVTDRASHLRTGMTTTLDRLAAVAQTTHRPVHA
jgi:uncharacterized protein YndB with AHSA1/START domain